MLTNKQKDILAEYIKRTGVLSSEIRAKSLDEVGAILEEFSALRNAELDVDQATIDASRDLYS